MHKGRGRGRVPSASKAPTGFLLRMVHDDDEGKSGSGTYGIMLDEIVRHDSDYNDEIGPGELWPY